MLRIEGISSEREVIDHDITKSHQIIKAFLECIVNSDTV